MSLPLHSLSINFHTVFLGVEWVTESNMILNCFAIIHLLREPRISFTTFLVKVGEASTKCSLFNLNKGILIFSGRLWQTFIFSLERNILDNVLVGSNLSFLFDFGRTKKIGIEIYVPFIETWCLIPLQYYGILMLGIFRVLFNYLPLNFIVGDHGIIINTSVILNEWGFSLGFNTSVSHHLIMPMGHHTISVEIRKRIWFGVHVFIGFVYFKVLLC